MTILTEQMFQRESPIEMQLVILEDDRGITYEYYGAKIGLGKSGELGPRITKVTLGPMIEKDELVEFLLDGTIDGEPLRVSTYN